MVYCNTNRIIVKIFVKIWQISFSSQLRQILKVHFTGGRLCPGNWRVKIVNRKKVTVISPAVLFFACR